MKDFGKDNDLAASVLQHLSSHHKRTGDYLEVSDLVWDHQLIRSPDEIQFLMDCGFIERRNDKGTIKVALEGHIWLEIRAEYSKELLQDMILKALNTIGIEEPVSGDTLLKMLTNPPPAASYEHQALRRLNMTELTNEVRYLAGKKYLGRKDSPGDNKAAYKYKCWLTTDGRDKLDNKNEGEQKDRVPGPVINTGGSFYGTVVGQVGNLSQNFTIDNSQQTEALALIREILEAIAPLPASEEKKNLTRHLENAEEAIEDKDSDQLLKSLKKGHEIISLLDKTKALGEKLLPYAIKLGSWLGSTH